MEMMADPEITAEQLFGEALELRPDRRAAFLDQACRHAPELRRLVEELLRDNGGGVFMSLTADGQPAMMSHTGVAQIYSSRWKH